MAEKVRAYDRLGNKIEVDKAEVGQLYALGGRIAKREEQDLHDAEIRQEERAEKAGVAGKIQTVLGAAGGVLNPLAFTGGAGSVGESYNKGVTGGLTANLDEVVARKAIDATAGTAAGAKYAQQVDDIKLTSPTAHTAGEIMGFVAGAAAPVPTPAGAIGKLGNLAERGAGLVLKGGGGAMRQALTTGGKMAIRGAVEGAAMGGVQSAADDLLHDNPINGKKLYAAMGHNALAGAVIGGGLGTGGSLLSSGIKSARAGAARSLMRASEGATAEAGAAAKSPMLGGLLDADTQAWKASGGGFGLQSTRYAKAAAKYFPEGERALGEVSRRYGVLEVPQGMTPTQAMVHSAKVNTPDQMLPRAQVALDSVGKQLGTITEASGARIQATQVMQAVEDVAKHYEATAATRPVGRSIRSFSADLVDSLGLRSLDDSTAIQNLIRERKGIDRIAFQDAPTLDPKTALEAKRMLRGKLEDIIETALDEAGGKVPGELRAQYTGLKKDYHKLSLLTETLEDSSARAAKAATFGLGEKGAAAMAVAQGNLAAAPVLALGGKVLRERGNAAAAAYLTRAAEQKAVAKLLKANDAARTAAAAGVLREAEVAPAKASKVKAPKQVTAEEGRAQQREVISQANAIVKWSGDVKANPRKVLDALQEAGAVVGRAAGSQTSAAYTESTMRAMQFIMRYVPVKERRDPLDPRSVPPLTFEEASRLVRATNYATKPLTVWKDFERGIVTPEGLAAANEFMADDFAEFRAELLEHVTTHLAKGGRYSAAQRLRVDKLLGIPGGADLRGPALVQLQANLASEGPDNSSGPTPAKSTGGGNKPVNMQVQQSGFDSVEARKSG
jgi:hypothetical protein